MMASITHHHRVILQERVRYGGELASGSPEAKAVIEKARQELNPGVPQPNTPPAWSIKTTDGAVFRKTCERCGAGVQGKRYCKPCAVIVRDDGKRESYTPMRRVCEDCNVSISGYNARSIRCTKCQKKHAAKLCAERVARKHEAESAATAERFGVEEGVVVLRRPCKRCDGPIIGKHRNSTYCDACRVIVGEESKRKAVERQSAIMRQRRAEARAKRQQVST